MKELVIQLILFSLTISNENFILEYQIINLKDLKKKEATGYVSKYTKYSIIHMKLEYKINFDKNLKILIMFIKGKDFYFFGKKIPVVIIIKYKP